MSYFPADPVRHFVRPMLLDGTLASTLSTLALAWRGRRDIGSAVAPLNAPSHWIWGDAALRRNGLSVRYTLLGTSLHYASAVFWAALYRWLRYQRTEPTTLNAVTDAAAVTAVAAVVDLRVVPQRLTPGFERRLSPRSTAWVYVAFGAGLALGGMLLQRR